MLILTRRTGETVMIGSDVTLTVLGVKGSQVRIGINAPKHVAVHREEIFNRIKRELAGGEVNGNVQDAPPEQEHSTRPEPRPPRMPAPVIPNKPEPDIPSKPAPVIHYRRRREVPG